MSVTDLDAVKRLPSELPSEFANVCVLVNNAGLALGLASVDTNSLIDAQKMMDTNVLSIIAMCTAFAPGMKERGDGHIINMGSIAGHYAYSSGTMYCASKYAVRGFTEAARHDLVGTPVRMTHISPGMVGNTEFSNVRFNDDSKAASVYNNVVALHPDDIADNVVYAATRPAHVQIAEFMIYPTNQSGPQVIARVGENLGGKTVKK
jgi:NADP-dependent 3-hydroxy acid dehydrogenase YdfG